MRKLKYQHLWWDDLRLCTVDLARHPGRDMDGYSICATALLYLVAVSFLPQHLLLLDPSEAKLYSNAFASVTYQLWESSPSLGVDPFQRLIWAFEEEKGEEPFPRIKEKKQLVTRFFEGQWVKCSVTNYINKGKVYNFGANYNWIIA